MSNFPAPFDPTNYKRFVGAAVDNILSTYRAIMLSLAGTRSPI